MYSIAYLIAQLYPEKSLEEQQKLADRCLALSDYGEDTWRDVKREDLWNKDVQLRLVQTLYELQIGERGVVTSIMDSLEQWSDEQAIMFADASDEDQLFYELYYTFIGFSNFDVLGPKRQMYLLRDRFLVIAASWDLPLYTNVQDYFKNFATVVSMSEDGKIFTVSIRANDTLLGTEGKVMHTVGEWTKLFTEFVEKAPPGHMDIAVNDFIESDLEASRLDSPVKEMLYKIITLYHGCRTGLIWSELKDDETPPPGFSRKEKKEHKTADEYYLELLSAMNKEQFDYWFRDWQKLGLRLVETGKDDNYLNQLFYILTRKVDLNNQKQVDNLMGLFEGLRGFGWQLGADLLYFNEKDGKFNWNKEVVNALSEEVEELKKQTVISPAKK